MTTTDFLSRPIDERGNVVAQGGALKQGHRVTFGGRHNRLVMDGSTPLDKVDIKFLGDGGQVVVGSLGEGHQLSLELHVAPGSSIHIGNDVTAEGALRIRTTDGASVTIGDGCHFGTGVSILAEDVNGFSGLAEGGADVVVGGNVWIVGGSALRGGTRVGDGAVLEQTPLIDHEVEAGKLTRGLPASAVRPVSWDPQRVKG